MLGKLVSTGGVEELAFGRELSKGSVTQKAHPTNGEVRHEQRTDQHLPGQILTWTLNEPEGVVTLEVGSIRVRSQGELNHGRHLQRSYEERSDNE